MFYNIGPDIRVAQKGSQHSYFEKKLFIFNSDFPRSWLCCNIVNRGKNKHLWNLRFDLAEKVEGRPLEGLKSVTLKATFVAGNEEIDLLEKHQQAEMILLPVKPENPAEPEKPVHQLQITTSTTNPKASRFHTKLHHCGNDGKSAASSCR